MVREEGNLPASPAVGPMPVVVASSLSSVGRNRAGIDQNVGQQLGLLSKTLDGRRHGTLLGQPALDRMSLTGLRCRLPLYRPVMAKRVNLPDNCGKLPGHVDLEKKWGSPLSSCRSTSKRRGICAPARLL